MSAHTDTHGTPEKSVSVALNGPQNRAPRFTSATAACKRLGVPVPRPPRSHYWWLNDREYAALRSWLS